MLRRTVALSLAVAVVWVVPVAGDQGPGSAPEATGRDITLEQWSSPSSGGTRAMSAASDDDWMVSGVVDAGDAVLVGADWGGDPDTEVQVRTRDARGWGEWTELHVHHEHTPDAGSAEAASAAGTASDPVFVGRVDDLQFRVSGTVAPDLDVKLVDIAGDLSWTPDRSPAGAAVAATDFPKVRPRASWGADESIRSRKVDYADDVRFSVIHHEGGAPRWADNNEIEKGCPSADDAIRAIYNYHVRTRGYWDIAYNFVVDPCGGIWEGRAGGIDKAVMGAHAGGWNQGSVGVLALGTFTDSNSDPVTSDMVRGIEDLLAWKLDIHHVDPRGTVREISGGGSSRYREGTPVDVPILSAHQITNSTSCPGGALMDRLFTGREASASPRWSYTNNVMTNGLPKAFDTQPARWTASEAGDRPEWDVHTTEPVDWSLRITDENDELVRATGGTGQDHIERTWDLRDSAGHLVDAGTYTATITGVDDEGDQISPVVTEMMVSSTVARRMGGDRIATSVALSEWAFDSADTAIVASSEAYPDALVSGPLAGSLDAPVLLTARNGLPESVEDEIERLGASQVFVIGGEVAIGASVEDELNSDLAGVTVERIGGGDRFATAAMVADRVAGDGPVSEVLLSLGQHEQEHRAFPDALSAGAFGADLQLPVLLTRRDSLPDATRTALRSMSPDTVRAFGGTVAITDGVTRAAATASRADVERFAGDTRYDTSRLAAEELLRRRGMLAPDEAADDQTPEDAASEAPTDDDAPLDLIFASGGNWPDALGAGAAAARTSAVFLLAHPTNMDDAPATRRFLDRWESRIGEASVAGGPVAITAAVVTALATYVTTSETVETEPIDWPADPHADATPAAGAAASPSDGPST